MSDEAHMAARSPGTKTAGDAQAQAEVLKQQVAQPRDVWCPGGGGACDVHVSMHCETM